ncbi:MAG: hypothetical protein M3312_11805 [Actinomycetota bacterium]|nr:hypothetical protein [Actinomycetota bacterium]
MSVSISSSGPSRTNAGKAWPVKLLVHGESDMLAEATPGIAIDGPGGAKQTFAAKRTGRRAPDGQLVYRVEVVFPSNGRWHYTIVDGVTDRAYEGGYVQVGPPATPASATKPPAPSLAGAGTDDAHFPFWPLVFGILAVGLTAAASLLALRRGRPSPTP